MKGKLGIAGMLLLYVTLLCAQETKEMSYLLEGDGKVKVSGFGGPIVEFTGMGGSIGVLTGGGGAVLLNQTVFFGGYGMGLTTTYRRDILNWDDGRGNVRNFYDLRTDFGHGGFWVGYIHQAYKPVHLGISTRLGWGAISLSRDEYGVDEYDSYGLDNVFVVNPQLEVEFNLFRWFKINLGAGYRFVTGVDKTYTTADGIRKNFHESNDFNQPEVSLSLLFGGFGSY
ncbi:MAG: hypothetical protein JW861_01550 [Bacteroidales bacterium]|nr:hypothetical protein [Bacteroidales bacterium]